MGRPKSPALSARRRMRPLRVLGSFSKKEISSMGFCQERLLATNSFISCASLVEAVYPGRTTTKAFMWGWKKRALLVMTPDSLTRRVTAKNLLDFKRPHGVLAEFDQIVVSSVMKEISVLVAHRHVAGQKPSIKAQVLAVFFPVAPNGGHHGGPTHFKSQLAHGENGQGMAVLVHHGRFHAGHGFTHGAGFHRH